MTGACLRRSRFEQLGPGGELGLQPVEGLTAERRFRRVIGRRIVLALPGSGQGGGAGGIVQRCHVRDSASCRVNLPGLTERGECVAEMALGGQGGAEFVMCLAVVGVEPDRLAVFCEGLVELPVLPQGGAEIGVRHGEVGLEADGLAELGDRPRRSRRISSRRKPPRLQWASAKSGLSRMASR